MPARGNSGCCCSALRRAVPAQRPESGQRPGRLDHLPAGTCFRGRQTGGPQDRALSADERRRNSLHRTRPGQNCSCLPALSSGSPRILNCAWTTLNCPTLASRSSRARLWSRSCSWRKITGSRSGCRRNHYGIHPRGPVRIWDIPKWNKRKTRCESMAERLWFGPGSRSADAKRGMAVKSQRRSGSVAVRPQADGFAPYLGGPAVLRTVHERPGRPREADPLATGPGRVMWRTRISVLCSARSCAAGCRPHDSPAIPPAEHP